MIRILKIYILVCFNWKDSCMGSDIDFKFYTGFPNYSNFKAFYEYLSPAHEHLIYLGSNTANVAEQMWQSKIHVT